MSRRWFGTDGIRGRVGEAPITADFMLRLGRAALLFRVAAGAGPEGQGAEHQLIYNDYIISDE